MSDKMIRFIDSGYNELFSIMDGGRIRVTYPPDDGKEPSVRQCKYLDDTHFEEADNGTVWHIAQFAERMEAMGARYEPELQVAAELVSFAGDEAKMLYRARDEGNLCVGQLRGDFGKRGDRFFHSWTDHDADRKTPGFQEEFQGVMFKLRQEPLEDHKAMAAYCNAHPEARLPKEEHRYGFKLETETRQYFLRCTTLKDDYFYVFVHDKPATALERAVPDSARGEDAPKTPWEQYPPLAALGKKLADAADAIVTEGLGDAPGCKFAVDLDDSEERFGLRFGGDSTLHDTLIEMLESREEVEKARYNYDEILVDMALGAVSREDGIATPIEVFIARKTAEGGVKPGEWLALPATSGELRAVLERIGFDGAAYISALRSPFVDVQDRVFSNGQTKGSIDELNMLAAYLKDMEPFELDKLHAAFAGDFQYNVYGAPAILNLLDADNFSGVDLIDANNAEELGWYWQEEKPERFSFEEYGRMVQKEENGTFTEWGYVHFKYKDLAAEYKGVVPEEYRIMEAAMSALSPRGAERGEESGRPSVMKQIREAKTALKQPHKAKTPGKHKGDDEL